MPTCITLQSVTILYTIYIYSFYTISMFKLVSFKILKTILLCAASILKMPLTFIFWNIWLKFLIFPEAQYKFILVFSDLEQNLKSISGNFCRKLYPRAKLNRMSMSWNRKWATETQLWFMNHYHLLNLQSEFKYFRSDYWDKKLNEYTFHTKLKHSWWPDVPCTNQTFSPPTHTYSAIHCFVW